MRVVFFGTPSFAAGILEHLVLQSHHQVVGVVSKPDAPRGRGQKVGKTPVHEVSERLLQNVPYLQPQKAIEIIDVLQGLQADVFVVVAYGEIIKKAVLDIPRLGCLNIHASLLPHLRGAAPIQRALMRGDAKTGITIMKMDVGMDTGPVLLQKEVKISENTTFLDLEAYLQEKAKEGIVEALQLVEENKAYFVPQDSAQATIAPKITEKELCLDPEADIKALHNIIRALSPRPGVFFHILVRGKPVRLKVLASLDMGRMFLADQPRFRAHPDGLVLVNSSGSLLVTKLQLEGKSPMDSSSFLRGYPADCLIPMLRDNSTI